MRNRKAQKVKPDFQKPGVVFPPETTRGILGGVNLLINAIRPTLGPEPRTVAVEKALENKPPELLDSGGTIARRIIQIPNRNQDVGLMFARHMLWTLQQKTGDGTATAGVIFQYLLQEGIKFKSAGGNVMFLGKYLQDGLQVILGELDRQITPLRGREQLTYLAESVCYDAELADHLGQVFETIGPYGRLEVRSNNTREVRHEYIQGVYWDSTPFSPEMILDKKEVRTMLYNGAVLATDLEVKEASEIIALLQTALEVGIDKLLLIVAVLDSKAMAPLLNPQNRKKITVLAVKTPGTGMEAQAINLMDLAILTGGRPLLKATQARLENVTAEDFGYARRIWLYKETFGITNGRGNVFQLRDHVQRLQEVYHETKDGSEAEKLLNRLGHLMQGSATLWIGALTDAEYQRRKESALRTGRALRMALMDGVLPGGGTALLACQEALENKLHQAENVEAVAAFRMLSRAVQEPFRVLMANAGINPGRALAELAQAGDGYGVDLRSQKITAMRQAGILDPALVIKEALHSAIASAALLLTTDVLVHKRNPAESYHTT